MCDRVDQTTAAEKRGLATQPEEGSNWKAVEESLGTAREEARAYGDILFLDCVEGYSHGRLTQKLHAAMLFYVRHTQAPFFMKTDDDTFVRFNELLPKVRGAKRDFLVAGVFYWREDSVQRDPADKWYEPYNTWPHPTFPAPAIVGGPGYVLSRNLTTEILRRDLPQRFPLWNEDRAITVWVEELEKSHPIARLCVQGSDGYTLDGCEAFADTTWGQYHLILQHLMTPEALGCMGKGRRPGDSIAECFCTE